ncbi:vacuolar fusion protein MON1, putative [Plasmodium malariae]|uniref:Vacuolar fusion protein MON1, putative n=1 Tax=Plasmodium malariae TaxID=5858 RepID=A0A1C3L055_PLAMA|nr:vacuolar fusion protein MON1, putative [Plasmodium malariae]
MEITYDKGNEINEKKNINPSYVTCITDEREKSVACVIKNDERIINSSCAEDGDFVKNNDTNFYDVRGLDEIKEHYVNSFIVNNKYSEELLKIKEPKLVQYNEVYNSNTDDDLEHFFEDNENEKEASRTMNFKANILLGKEDSNNSNKNSNHINKYSNNNSKNSSNNNNNSNLLGEYDNSFLNVEDEYENFYNNHDFTSSINNEVNVMKMFDPNKKEDSECSFLNDTMSNKSYEQNSLIINKKLTINMDITHVKEVSNERDDDLSFISNSSNSLIRTNLVDEEGGKEEQKEQVSEGEKDEFKENGNDRFNEEQKDEFKKERKNKFNEEEKNKFNEEEKNKCNEEEKNKFNEEEKNKCNEEEKNKCNEEEKNKCNEEKDAFKEEEKLRNWNKKANSGEDNRLKCRESLNNMSNNSEKDFRIDETEEKVIFQESDLYSNKNSYEGKGDLGSLKSNKVNILNYFENSESQDNINNSKFLLRKKKVNEDQTTPLWYKHKRHFFIFTYSGKPVFTRYGNEENLTSFYGTLLAIISKIESFTFSDINSDNKTNKKYNETNTKNSLKYIISKNTKVVYLDKEVLCLVCISKVNESNNYIMNILNYMYFQIISLLTKSIDKSFQIKPSFDIRYLLDGADLLMCNLISSCSKNMYSIFDGFEPLPLKQEHRNKIHNLISSFKISNVLLSFLIINDKVIGISISKYTINSMDIIILINMITSMKSFKNAESWTPICLPIYNPNLFLYAYINYIKKKICCVYICSYASSRDFFHLSRHTSMIETMLLSSGCYDEIVKASNSSPFVLPEIGIDIIHLCYYIPYLKQYYSSKISHDKIKRIFRVYQKCDDILKDSKLPAQIYIESEYEKFYSIKTNLYHLYLAVPFHVQVNDETINEILRVIATYHKEIFINNIKQITS